MINASKALPVLLALSTALAALQGHAQDQGSAPTQPSLTLKSVSVDLPTSDRMFPGGATAEVINNNCLACHSAGMVLNQPALTKAAWDAEVRKMINVYKAPVAPEDVAAIVAYLDSTKGIKPGEGTPQTR
jgi:mono/diheme cytochrome c family protein